MTDRVASTNHFRRRRGSLCFFLVAFSVLVMLVAVQSVTEYDVDRLSRFGEPFRQVETSPAGQQVKTRLSEAPCSFEIIQNAVNSFKRFPTEGSWLSTQPDKAIYQPSICKFEYHKPQNLPETFFEKCAKKKGLTSMLILGDSNGRRQYEAFLELLKASDFSCDTIKIESPSNKYMPDANYYSNGTGIDVKDIIVHRRDCYGCLSRKVLCSKYQNSEKQLGIEVEYISMEFLQDSEVTTFRQFRTNRCPPIPARCLVSTTTQQFIFGEYLYNNYPDIIFLNGNNHDPRRRSLRQIRVDMQTVLSLIKEYVPETKRVVWFTSPGENIQRKPKAWQREVFRLHLRNYTTNAMIQRINKDLFQVLEPELARADSRILSFFDIEAMGREVRGSWNLDGVHMREEWYQHIISYIIQTLCNSKIELK